MTKEYYIITWKLRPDYHTSWETKAVMYDDVENVLNSVRNMELGKEKGCVADIIIRQFHPKTGALVVMEPYLKGWEVGLRQVIPLAALIEMDEYPDE